MDAKARRRSHARPTVRFIRWDMFATRSINSPMAVVTEMPTLLNMDRMEVFGGHTCWAPKAAIQRFPLRLALTVWFMWGA